MAANTKIWLGDSAGDPDNWDWDDAPGFADSNWVDDDGVRCAKPVDGDSVIITGAQDIQDGLDQSAVDLTRLLIHEDYTGDIGSAGNWLEFDTTTYTDHLFYSATGTNYLKGRFYDVRITGTGSAGELHLWQTGVGGYFTCSKGTIYLSLTAAVYFDFCAVGYQNRGAQLSDVTLSIDSTGAGGGYLVRYFQSGGTVDVDDTAKLTFVAMAGGSLDYLGSAGISMLALSGGTVYLGEDANTPTGIMLGENGVLDMRTTESAVNVNALLGMPGGMIKLDNGAANITFSQLINHGADIQIDNGRIYEAQERDLS